MNRSTTNPCQAAVPRPIWRRQRAFTLVEVLAATFVTAILFSVLFAGTSSTFALLEMTRENLRATQIVVSRLEGLRLCAWSDAQLFNTNIVPRTFTDSFYPLGLQSTTNRGTQYAGTITISTNFALNPPASYAGNLALATVTVSWTNVSGTVAKIQTRTMNTLVARHGVQNYIISH